MQDNVIIMIPVADHMTYWRLTGWRSCYDTCCQSYDVLKACRMT